jgi:beta-glucosidase
MTAFIERFFNTAFLNALTEGRWAVPGMGTWKIPEARQTLDFLGVNFYGRQFIRLRFTPGKIPQVGCDLGHHTAEVRERTLMGWDLEPSAFTQTLLRGSRLGLPILVTENGTWLQTDEERWRFIAGNLEAMHRAMEQGANIIGYCYWSLLDNFEWDRGFEPRFGLIEVDYATQQRRIRESARRYAEVCRTNKLTAAD